MWHLRVIRTASDDAALNEASHTPHRCSIHVCRIWLVNQLLGRLVSNVSKCHCLFGVITLTKTSRNQKIVVFHYCTLFYSCWICDILVLLMLAIIVYTLFNQSQSILLFKWHALKMLSHVSWLMSHCGFESVGEESKEKGEVKCDIKYYNVIYK